MVRRRSADGLHMMNAGAPAGAPTSAAPVPRRRTAAARVGSAASAEAGGVEESEGRLRVLDLAPLHHRQCPRKGDGIQRQKLVELVARLAAGEPGGQEEVDLLVREAWRREHGEEVLDVRRRAPRLLF